MKRELFLRRPLPYRFYNITIKLIIINGAIFLLNFILPLFSKTAVDTLYSTFALNTLVNLDFQHIWQVFTYMFLHDPRLFFHILFNMFALFMFGIPLERKMGSSEFLLYYLFTGAATGIILLFLYPLLGIPAIIYGASAAVYGVLLAFATFFPDVTLYIWGILPIKAYAAVLGFALLALVFQLFNIMGGVSHLGHLVGLFVGFLYFIIRLRINPIKVFLSMRR